jgi:hypothetical protein
MTGAEWEAVREMALAEEQSDPLVETLADATLLVRGYVAACPRNRLGAEGTVPAALRGATLAVAAYRALSRLPVSSLISEARTRLHDSALDTLNSTAACKFAVELPDEGEAPPEKTPAGAGVKLALATRPQFSRAQMGGL